MGGPVRVLVASGLLLATVSAQLQGLANHHHPAAGPDFLGAGLGSLLDDHQFLTAPDGRKEGLIDPSPSLIEPLRQQAKRREEQLRLEQEEISRVLSEAAAQSRSHGISLSAWVGSIVGCLLVVACGIVPAFLLPANSGEFLQSEDGRKKLNLLLSFAVGSLLGDVFLHLLPETWSTHQVDRASVGLWVLAGLLVCFFVEKLCAHTEESQHRMCAWMNLAANIVDNFTHGLAVGGSFLVSPTCGVVTTAAILLHEIPHEVSDFAILLRADFDRWSAVKAQAITAVAGVAGSISALRLHSDSSLGGSAGWVLPFTAGGFINIALAQILPELMNETCPKQTLKQLALIAAGISTMYLFNGLHV
ncbi:unnamed protein product, partial [Mesorhabditis spiculigera]